tara:strand:+ start:216 stop:479 length:264 start_codon:yes stop_codon:yes gene_type:complete
MTQWVRYDTSGNVLEFTNDEKVALPLTGRGQIVFGEVVNEVKPEDQCHNFTYSKDSGIVSQVVVDIPTPTFNAEAGITAENQGTFTP